MRNLGNVCYAIATLQCLLRTSFVLGVAPALPGTVAHAVASLAAAPTDEALTRILVGAGYDLGQQQDAEEFLLRMLAATEGASDALRGRQVITTTCPTCGDAVVRHEDSLIQGLCVEERASVDALLARALGAEEIEGATPCHVCLETARRREVRQDLWPAVLVLRLGRTAATLEKTFLAVQLAARLLTPQAEAEYALVGVVCHLGPSMSGGHYVAHVSVEGVWQCANDDHVSVSDPVADTVVAHNCCLLFFQRTA